MKLWDKCADLANQIKKEFQAKKIYQARWVWYHTILAFELLIILFVLIGILIKI